MFEVDYCDQAGAQPPTPVGSFSWSEAAPITARRLIAERVRREFEGRFERFDAHVANCVPNGCAEIGRPRV
ncbi:MULTISPECIES: hypothetical protein [unclassified Bradyrhizobium]